MNAELDAKLLLVLFIIWFSEAFIRGSGTMIAGVKGAVAQGKNIHHKGNNSLLLNVKDFGARADGRTDDSKVCLLSPSP